MNPQNPKDFADMSYICDLPWPYCTKLEVINDRVVATGPNGEKMIVWSYNIDENVALSGRAAGDKSSVE